MQNLIRATALVLFCLGAAIATGCSPISRGATAQGFAVGGQPDIEIFVTPELGLHRSGQKTVFLATDTITPSQARMTYAVFGETKDHFLNRHAHTFFITPTSRNWIFQPETYTSRYAISTSKQTVNGRRFTVQTLFIPSEDDWFSALWRENGYSLPENWLAMRWSTNPNNRERIVAEYREPLPPCVQEHAAWQDLLDDRSVKTIDKQQLWLRCGQELGNFERRAHSAILFDKKQTDASSVMAAKLERDSSQNPDFTDQAGELELFTTERYRFKR